MAQNYWLWGIVISFVAHVWILASTFPSMASQRSPGREKSMTEIKVVATQNESNSGDIRERINNQSEPQLANRIKTPPQYSEKLLKNLVPSRDDIALLNKAPLNETPVLEKITLTDILPDKNLKDNPDYMDYYRIIREKIRSNAYDYYNNSERGEIRINFILLKDGTVGDLRIKTDSTENTGLKEIAIRSVRTAAPFPAFPESLKEYPRMQFNISIYFKSN